MNELVQWLNEEAERLEKEQATSSEPYKTVNHSFIQGFYYALAHVELFNDEGGNKMKYTWTEKGTRFNNKDYHFTMEYEEVYGCVSVTCTYGSYSTRVLFSPDAEQYIYESLDEMKELLYNKSYI